MGKIYEGATGTYICCPGCGRPLLKSSITDSTVTCQKCHKHIYAFKAGDLLIQTSASRLEDDNFVKRMKTFVFDMNDLMNNTDSMLRL